MSLVRRAVSSGLSSSGSLAQARGRLGMGSSGVRTDLKRPTSPGERLRGPSCGGGLPGLDRGLGWKEAASRQNRGEAPFAVSSFPRVLLQIRRRRVERHIMSKESSREYQARGESCRKCMCRKCMCLDAALPCSAARSRELFRGATVSRSAGGAFHAEHLRG